MTDPRFQHDAYTIRRKVFTVVGASFHVFDPNGEVVFFSRQKAFKLKEDLRLFSDEEKTEELLTIRARQVVDFGATYDVFDPVSNESIGSLRRKGLKSMIRDEWLIFDGDEREIGIIREDNAGLAALRRVHDLFSLIAPQAFHAEANGVPVALYHQNRNPFVHKLDVTFAGEEFDRRLGIAIGILISAIEGRQN